MEQTFNTKPQNNCAMCGMLAQGLIEDFERPQTIGIQQRAGDRGDKLKHFYWVRDVANVKTYTETIIVY